MTKENFLNFLKSKKKQSITTAGIIIKLDLDHNCIGIYGRVIFLEDTAINTANYSLIFLGIYDKKYNNFYEENDRMSLFIANYQKNIFLNLSKLWLELLNKMEDYIFNKAIKEYNPLSYEKEKKEALFCLKNCTFQEIKNPHYKNILETSLNLFRQKILWKNYKLKLFYHFDFPQAGKNLDIIINYINCNCEESFMSKYAKPVLYYNKEIKNFDKQIVNYEIIKEYLKYLEEKNNNIIAI